MARILGFFPENDLALADYNPGYTPPRAAVHLRESGSLLPLWLAGPDDYVLVPREQRDAARMLKERFGLDGAPVSGLGGINGSFAPWGWSPYTARVYQKRGIHPDLVPSEFELEIIREASHRRSSIFLNEGCDATCPVVAYTWQEAVEAIRQNPQGSILKSPWSSSGRGIMAVGCNDACKAATFIEGCIRHQGSVMIERRLEKIADFALLFDVEGVKARFSAISLFFVEHGSAYIGNVVAPQQYIHDYLAKAAGVDSLQPLIARTETRFNEFLRRYSNDTYHGPAGIDMMVYASPDDGSPKIAPCVELNLRCTMGVVATAVARHIQPSAPMIMSVGPRQPLAPDAIDISGIPDSRFSITLNNLHSEK